MSDHASKIGWISATTIVAASMIGVGVFTTSGFALAALGSPMRVMLAWTIGSMIAVCGAISYSALGSKFTESGGEYLFLARTLHPAAGLTAGFVSMLAGFTGPIAAAALGLEAYASGLMGGAVDQIPANTIAISVIFLAAVLHSLGLRWAVRVQDIVVLVKLVLIIGFIGFALSRLIPLIGSADDLTGQAGSAAAENSESLSPFSWTSLAQQLVWISFSFAGFNAAIYIAEEIREPQRNVPRAMIAGTCFVSVLYLLLNGIFVWSAPVSVITADQNISQIASTAAMAVGGAGLSTLVRWVIVISLATSVSAMVMTGPRVYAKIAQDGFLPRFFAFQGRVPTAAIWAQAAFSIGVVCLAELRDLLSYLGLTLSLCSALAISAIFVLRYRGQIERLPGWGIPPAIFILATVTFAVIASWGDIWPAIAAVATLGLGGASYPWVRKKSEAA